MGDQLPADKITIFLMEVDCRSCLSDCGDILNISNMGYCAGRRGEGKVLP